MEKFKKIGRFIAAFFLALLPFLFLCGLAYAFYYEIGGAVGSILAALSLLLGIYLGYQIFITVKRRGFFEFITAQHATPAMDKAKPSKNSDVIKRSVFDLVDNFKLKKHIFQSGYTRIWGDWESRELQKQQDISDISYNKAEDSLSIIFKNQNQLTIWKPKGIYETDSYLKIEDAKQIKWEWNEKNHFMEYRNGRKEIETSTNSNWETNGIDVLKGNPALLLLHTD